MAKISPEVRDLIAEFEWTRDRHDGDVKKAAPMFGMTPAALEQAFRRANKQAGEVLVRFKGMKS